MIAPFRIFLLALVLWPLGAASGETEVISEIPPPKFQGVWKVTKVTWQKRHQHEPDAAKITEETVIKGRVKRIYFRKHRDKIHSYDSSEEPDDPTWRSEIAILNLTETTLEFRHINSHKDQFQKLDLGKGNTAILTVYWPKSIETYYLKKRRTNSSSPSTTASF